jgi:hypothetical protein
MTWRSDHDAASEMRQTQCTSCHTREGHFLHNSLPQKFKSRNVVGSFILTPSGPIRWASSPWRYSGQSVKLSIWCTTVIKKFSASSRNRHHNIWLSLAFCVTWTFQIASWIWNCRQRSSNRIEAHLSLCFINEGVCRRRSVAPSNLTSAQDGGAHHHTPAT